MMAAKRDEEEEEVEKSYMDITELEQMKIPSSDIDKLKEANYFTVESIAYTPKIKISEINIMSEGKINNIIEAGWVNDVFIG